MGQSKRARVEDLPRVHEAFDALWKTLKEIPFDPNAKVLDLGIENVFAAPPESRVLFLRPCYHDMFQIVMIAVENNRHANIGIAGTSGIGKSAFEAYVLHRLWHNPSKFTHVILQTKEGAMVVFDLKDKDQPAVTVTDYWPYESNPNCLYIIDDKNKMKLPVQSDLVDFFPSIRSRLQGFFQQNSSSPQVLHADLVLRRGARAD
jgi:hypothetical protein